MTIYTIEKGREIELENNSIKLKKMENGILTLDWASVKRAAISTVIMAIAAGAVYVIGLGDIFAVNFHSLTNIIAISLLTGFVSLVNSLFTTNDDKFAGIVKTN